MGGGGGLEGIPVYLGGLDETLDGQHGCGDVVLARVAGIQSLLERKS